MTTTALQLDSVRFGDDGAAELDHGRALVFVPHEEITRVELAHAAAVGRPLLVGTLGIGVIVMAVAVPVLLTIKNSLQFRLGMRMLLSFLLVIPGSGLIGMAVRKRWVVIVHSTRGSRRLVFQGTQDRAAMEQFLASVRERFGYL